MEQTVNPSMITLAREARSLSQSQLAKLLNVPQSKVSKMESGHIGVSPDMLAALVRELKYPEKFFYQNFDVYPAGMHLYQYRKHKTLHARDLSRIVAWMNIYRSHVRNLLTAAEVEYKPVPEYDIDEFDSIAAIARAVRHHAGLPSGPVQNMTAVVEDMGVVVVPFDPGTRLFSGASMLSEKPNYVVVVNSQMPGDRLRWTLAHELGHMVMHRVPTPNMEAEADEFAAEFLMPAKDIAPYFSEASFPSIEKLASLKRIWKVSMSALLMQAKRLRYITENQYRVMVTKMGQVGITRLKEPPELNVPFEQPTLLTEIVDFHAQELGYTADQLSDLLALEVNDFLERYRFTGRTLRVVRNVS